MCWRLCLVRACLVPPAKPHMSHRYDFSPGDRMREEENEGLSKKGANIFNYNYNIEKGET